jgi:predicted MPP superfamily phosphohydrolase
VNKLFFPVIFLIITLLIDWYGFNAVKSLFAQSKYKVLANSIYIATIVYTLLFFVASFTFNFREQGNGFTKFMFGVLMGIFVSKILWVLFIGIEDLTRLMRYGVGKATQTLPENGINRSEFLNIIFLMIASLPFFSFIYGMLKTAYDYKIHRHTLYFPNLPAAFDNFKLVQLSDIHSGTFSKKDPLIEAIKTINSLQPNLFVFTGDLVNNRSEEYTDYIDIFKNIKATHGQFSITGNHDYGDYVQWETKEAKKANFEQLKSYHDATHWKLLLNEHAVIEENGEKIALIGIENWGAKMRFARYGNLQKAHQGTENIPFKILLSHDPSHWDAEVREQYTDIDLTLSGHTHGMQFGVETKWFRFSPVQWVYKQWAGLYKAKNQFLYVNRGFGFIGYPGRVGIRPEITEITFKRGES